MLCLITSTENKLNDRSVSTVKQNVALKSSACSNDKDTHAWKWRWYIAKAYLLVNHKIIVSAHINTSQKAKIQWSRLSCFSCLTCEMSHSLSSTQSALNNISNWYSIKKTSWSSTSSLLQLTSTERSSWQDFVTSAINDINFQMTQEYLLYSKLVFFETDKRIKMLTRNMSTLNMCSGSGMKNKMNQFEIQYIFRPGMADNLPWK
jgi:hypothetical protein